MAMSYARKVAILAYAREGMDELVRISQHAEVAEELQRACRNLAFALGLDYDSPLPYPCGEVGFGLPKIDSTLYLDTPRANDPGEYRGADRE